MSKYKYEGYGVIRDTDIDFPYHTDDIVELLDEKDQQIAELEAKLTKKDKEQNQKAVEQLEKVKKNIKKVPITDFDLSGNFEKMYKQDAIRQIDNQINELKGKVEDVKD